MTWEEAKKIDASLANIPKKELEELKERASAELLRRNDAVYRALADR